MDKVIFYIDGFNFYNGLRDAANKLDGKPDSNRWKKFYWLDIVRFCSQFLEENETLVCVKYFTARPLNSGKRERQNRLLKVNQELNNDHFKVFYGKYVDIPTKCMADCKKMFTRPEEKQTDVGIAVAMLEDYFIGLCEKTVLISADSDLVPPLDVINSLNRRKGGSHKLNVFFPPARYSTEIADKEYITTLLLKNYRSRFNKALLGSIIKIKGKKYEIPPRWSEFIVNQPEG